MHVQLQRRAEALHEGDGPAGRLSQSPSTHAPPLPRKQHAQARLQRRRDEVRTTAERKADSDGKREHPLSIRRAGQHAVDEVGRGILGATRGARWADAAALARKRHQQLVSAGAAANAREAASEHAAADHAVEFTLDDARHDVAASTSSGDKGSEVQPDRAV